MNEDVFSFGPVERHHLVEWCAAENDYYALHYDDTFAAAMGFEQPLIQGTYKFAAAGQILVRSLGPGAQLRSLSIRYGRPDAVGATLRVETDVTGSIPVDGGERLTVVFRIIGAGGVETARGEAVLDRPVNDNDNTARG